MDDVTDIVFRQIVNDLARPDLFFTEFVNVDGLQSPGRARLLPKLRFAAKEQPIIAQIWGSQPDNYYKTTKDLIGMGFSGVDINMGCPAKPVIKNGCCSALINNRPLAADIIKATQLAAAGAVPVSVKTRLGFSHVDMSWIEFLLEQKLDMLTIHMRTTKEMSKVPAHWELMTQIKELRDRLAPQTLLVGNGDVVSRQQGEELARQHQIDGVMIGRGIFYDPYVFAKQSPWANVGKIERLNMYKRHVDLFAQTWQANERRLVTLNKFCKVYIQGFDGAKELREQLMNATTSKELLSLLDSFAGQLDAQASPRYIK